ncbi:hypothetical protein Namu_3495 [Nakamurella multipartita DSM 44233]|uniref:Uncharacterized protein n=1 Tax=Nakamurella multipartita (strain ATCC 700099 / DSM 44233 / CIP 104796 / JCM 9543 / NBRC 105858 / Y-104) TaxID=479431 RepID=C8XER9_NAKMY|nr:hypothetical protein Namu_3495 [Nakamurella multipartita DSM 44233]
MVAPAISYPVGELLAEVGAMGHSVGMERPEDFERIGRNRSVQIIWGEDPEQSIPNVGRGADDGADQLSVIVHKLIRVDRIGRRPAAQQVVV